MAKLVKWVDCKNNPEKFTYLSTIGEDVCDNCNHRRAHHTWNSGKVYAPCNGGNGDSFKGNCMCNDFKHDEFGNEVSKVRVKLKGVKRK